MIKINTIPASYNGLTVGKKSEVVKNRFSGEPIELEPLAVAMYDAIMGYEAFGLYDRMQEGLTWFRKYYPKAYHVLLD